MIPSCNNWRRTDNAYNDFEQDNKHCRPQLRPSKGDKLHACLKYYPGTCLKGLCKTKKFPIKLHDFPTEVQTVYVPNKIIGFVAWAKLLSLCTKATHRNVWCSSVSLKLRYSSQVVQYYVYRRFCESLQDTRHKNWISDGCFINGRLSKTSCTHFIDLC
jgi:hypothetical protein